MDVNILNVKDYISAKKSVFTVASILLFVSQIDGSTVELTGQLSSIYLIATLLLSPLKVILGVLMLFLIVRAFEVRLPIRKIVPEFTVGFLGALCFGFVSLGLAS